MQPGLIVFFQLMQPDFIVLVVLVGGSLLSIVGADNGLKLMSELVDL
jgi:hypothetical protein